MYAETGILILVLVTLALLVGSLTRQLLKRTQIPYTVALLIIGLIVGYTNRTDLLASAPLFQDSLDLVSEIEPHLILFVFLPVLIFESAFALEVHLFRLIFTQIAILAVPGLIIATLATAALSKWLLPWEWSWAVALMFGALISATDPVAVVALLKEVSSRKRLETLIEGESLVNDGTAIVLFTLFASFVAVVSMAPDRAPDLSLPGIAIAFIWVVLMGLFIGLAVGWVAVTWVGKVFNDPMIEIAISIASAYLAFFLAENIFHVSGVVAVVALALLFASVGRTRISPEVTEFLHHFWEIMAYIANTLIFLLVGVIIASRVQLDSGVAWVALGGLYIGVQVIRAASVTLFMPILSRIGIGITREKATVLVWGGLRGAVALALALSVAQADSIPREIGDQILFLTAGIVVLTILVNGTSMRFVLRYLGLDRLPPAKQVTVDKAERHIQQELTAYLQKLQANQFLQGADWPSILQQTNLSPRQQQTATADQQEESPQAEAADPPTQAISELDLDTAYRRRLLETERQSYWQQYKTGTLGRDAVGKLVDCVERALDGIPTVCPRPDLNEVWRTPPLLQRVKNIPALSHLAIRLSFKRMVTAYDVARGFIQAQDEMMSHIHHLAPTSDSAEIIKMEILHNKKTAYAQIEQLLQSFPEVISTLETHTAMRLILNRRRGEIEHLLETAVLDKPEAKRLITAVEEQMMRLSKKPAARIEVEPGQFLRKLPWVHNLPDKIINQLVAITEIKVYAADEAIFTQNASGGSLAIIVRGSVETQINNIADEILGPGSVIGALSLLSDCHDRSVKANTPVEALLISGARLRPIMQREPLLATDLSKFLGS